MSPRASPAPKRRTATLTEETVRDDLGRSRFVMDWKQDGRPRGQYFFADLEAHAAQLRAEGWRVVVRARAQQALL